MESSTILVTGGAGYVGSHACKALAEAGFRPVTYDNLSRGHVEAVRWGPLEVGDILDEERLQGVIRGHRPAAVMHFAASAEVGESVRDPAKYYRNNVRGSLTLLEAMKGAGLTRLVFSSTCAVYGMPQTPVLSEDHPRAPSSPYGTSKLMVEMMLADFAAAYGIASMALRYFNAAGADAGGEIGEAHDPETHLIPRAIDAAFGRFASLTVMGTDYGTPDGTCIRDYVHVADLASAHVAALRALERRPGFTACNLGTGRGHSVREIIEAVARASGRSVPTEDGPRRPGDPDRLVAFPARAHELLGWRPVHSGIDEIVSSACAWAQRAGFPPLRAGAPGADG